jgi:hypothetical protein
MTKRRRIGLRESFSAAAKADDGGGDVGILATLATALWFWVRGVPDDGRRNEPDGP